MKISMLCKVLRDFFMVHGSMLCKKPMCARKFNQLACCFVGAVGIFQRGILRSLSETLEENSAEEKQKQREKLRAENIRRFSEQGGFQLLVRN